jgi:hypothetical protein
MGKVVVRVEFFLCRKDGPLNLDSAIEMEPGIPKPRMDPDKHGFLIGFSVYPPGEPAALGKFLVSVPIPVNSWLNCGF